MSSAAKDTNMSRSCYVCGARAAVLHSATHHVESFYTASSSPTSFDPASFRLANFHLAIFRSADFWTRRASVTYGAQPTTFWAAASELCTAIIVFTARISQFAGLLLELAPPIDASQSVATSLRRVEDTIRALGGTSTMHPDNLRWMRENTEWWYSSGVEMQDILIC